MDAIVIAGGIPGPEEPLYPETQGKPKALLDICGKPMIQWVLDALCDADKIGNVVIIGLPEDSGVGCAKAKAFIPSQGDMLSNIRGGTQAVVDLNPDAKHVVIASSDIPSLHPEAINWVVNTAMQTDEDIYYNVVTREVMEGRFPDSRRSYVHLKGMDVCGGDLNVVRAKTVMQNVELWDRLVDSRKSALKQAALIGYDTLVLLMLRMITLNSAIKKVTRRLGVTGRALVCPYAEIAMDVDKQHQLAIMRADLAR